MKLEKAIELGLTIKKVCGDLFPLEGQKAMSLLIEAGRRCQRLRSDKHCSPIKLLPGETEE